MSELIFTEDQIKEIDKRISKKLSEKLSEELSKLQLDRAISFNFSYFERKFDGIDQRFIKLEESMNKRFDNLEKMIVRIRKRKMEKHLATGRTFLT